MASCENLCTAAKCAELETRIDELESKLITLESEVIAHVNFSLTRAHDFDLNITGLLQYDFDTSSIGLDLYLVDPTSTLLATAEITSFPLPYVPEWDFQQHINTSIPESHSYEPSLQVDVFGQDDGSNILKVQLDNVSDEDTFDLEPLQLTIDESSLTDGTNYQFTVSLGNKFAIANQLIKSAESVIEDEPIDEDFFFRIDDLANNDYQFTITIGDKTRSEILNLPLSSGSSGGTLEIPPTTVAVNGNYDLVNNNLNISVTVDGVSDAISINLDEMPFDEILECLALIKEKLEAEKELETVTIMAAPEVRANVKDELLILDFTTVAAFPELNETRSKWRVQIPAPVENITWDSLKDIRWFRGSQYGQAKLVGRINTISGWFGSETAANSYFAQIANITTLTIENIILPKHTNPKISPQEIETRVYRAFKVFIGANGEPNQALTQVFKPPVEEE